MMGNLLAPWIGWRLAFMLSAVPALLVVFILPNPLARMADVSTLIH